MKKRIKTVEKTILNTTFDADEFVSCITELIHTDDVITILRDILITLRSASNEGCGLHHVTLAELRSTLDTMNSVFDDGIGVEKSFITEMAGKSNDMSALIISPFTNSELLVVQLHEPGYMEELGIHAISCSCMHESLEDENPYMVGVIVLDPISESDVARQVLWHEVTHYLISYIGTFVDQDVVDCIDRIHNCNEFMADFLQFITFKTNLSDGFNDFMHYADKHFNDRVKIGYDPFIKVIMDMVYNDQSKYEKII